jgi:hypothetical protein
MRYPDEIPPPEGYVPWMRRIRRFFRLKHTKLIMMMASAVVLSGVAAFLWPNTIHLLGGDSYVGAVSSFGRWGPHFVGGGDSIALLATITFVAGYLWFRLVWHGVVVFRRHRASLGEANELAEQAGTGQPATHPQSNSKGADKSQPKSEGRSR